MNKIRAAFNLTPVGQATNLVGSLIEASNGNEKAALEHYVENTPLGTAADLTIDSATSIAHGASRAALDPEHAGAYLNPAVRDLFANGGAAIAGIAASESMSGKGMDPVTESIIEGARNSFDEICETTPQQKQTEATSDFEFGA